MADLFPAKCRVASWDWGVQFVSEALWESKSQTPRVLLYVFRQRDHTYTLSSIASPLLRFHPLHTERKGGIPVSEVLLDLSTASVCLFLWVTVCMALSVLQLTLKPDTLSFSFFLVYCPKIVKGTRLNVHFLPLKMRSQVVTWVFFPAFFSAVWQYSRSKAQPRVWGAQFTVVIKCLITRFTTRKDKDVEVIIQILRMGSDDPSR